MVQRGPRIEEYMKYNNANIKTTIVAKKQQSRPPITPQ